MKKNYTNEFILNALDLPIIEDFEGLSNHLGLSKRLIFLLSNNQKDYYKKFKLEKRNGGTREILVPSYSLKMVQRWILCEILEKVNVSNESMAFIKGKNRGIKANVEHHIYNLYLLEMDMKDFFTTIKRSKIYYLFYNLGYNSIISNIFANLCTYDGYLPQGGVCSPYLSNLISYKLDKRMVALCSKRDIVYTRYADDMTFSSNNKETLNKSKKVIIDIINDEGFLINGSKTRMLSPISHKVITGITVNNQEIKANKKLKRKIRAMIHHAVASGNYSEKNKIRGYISFVDFIEGDFKEKMMKYIDKLEKNENYRYFPEVVDGFNQNKLFWKLDDMILYEIIDGAIFDRNSGQVILESDYYSYVEEERESFMMDKGYIEPEYN